MLYQAFLSCERWIERGFVSVALNGYEPDGHDAAQRPDRERDQEQREALVRVEVLGQQPKVGHEDARQRARRRRRASSGESFPAPLPVVAALGEHADEQHRPVEQVMRIGKASRIRLQRRRCSARVLEKGEASRMEQSIAGVENHQSM